MAARDLLRRMDRLLLLGTDDSSDLVPGTVNDMLEFLGSKKSLSEPASRDDPYSMDVYYNIAELH